MLQNYLKIAVRNLVKNAGYSLINLFGLTIGLAACVLLVLYLNHELSFDGFHSKADRIYRVIERRSSVSEQDRLTAVTAAPVAGYCKSELPEIETTTQLLRLGRFTTTYGSNRFYEADYLFADPAFFDVFDFELTAGDEATALKEPNSVVLAPEAAAKYFGDENPIGKLLSVESLGPVKVTGLIKILPSNSHLQFSMLFSMSTLKGEGFKRYFESWKSDNLITYAVIREGADIQALQASMRNLVADKTKDQPTKRWLELQPLKDIHLYSTDIESDRNFQKSEPKYLYLFSTIALFVLSIASINYVNLATARSMNRAREVGVRKAVGARLPQLISQFVIESILMVFVALFLACGAVELFLPYFNTLASKHLHFSLLNDWMLAAVLLLFGLTVGLLSGAYPALHLSRLKIVEIFKGRTRAAKGERWIRSSLVTGQFALSIIMIIITIAAYRQLQFIQQKRLGFKSEQLLVIDINTGNVRKNLAAVKAAYAADPSVQSIAVSSRVPGEWKEIEQIDAHVSDRTTRSSFISCDEDFLKTFDMELIAGRNFSSGMGTDSLSVLINETAAIALGLSDPIGQRIRVPESHFEATIVGVVRDFHFRSLHEKVGPLVIGFLSPFGAHPIDGSDYFTIRFTPDRLTDMMEYLRKVGERFDPAHPFEYNFLDNKLAEFYKDDQRVSRLFLGGAGLTIIIACMGLFSLAAFAAEQRRKEIGIRRVLGASSKGLVMLLSKDFLKLVLFANVIAWPVAYVLMARWLEDFAYRIVIGVEIFAAAGILALIIAWVTVSWQAYRAASLNPVEALKYE